MKKKILLFGFCLAGCTLHAQYSGTSVYSEVPVGTTKYDMQTNKSSQNRIYRFADGTIGATWMFSQTTSFDDRGTGVNYFNGTTWGPFPTARIETAKSGWPSYAAYNTNGEVVVSHKALLAPLNIAKRTNKGSGSWTVGAIPPPPGVTGMLWARMVTNGPNHMNIHVIANTAPMSNGGAIYQGLDGAVLYNRSLDGGNSWMGWQLLPGMTSALYRGFSADTYEWAEPRGDTLCFVVGDNWNDLFIMKSTNNGASWVKTIIWNCLYNKWNGGSTVGLFYCPDGSNAVALDHMGKAHVVFGRQKAHAEYSGTRYYIPFTDGLIYWNETQPPLVQALDSATLTAGGHFIGWVQDPAVWTAGPSSLAYYGISMSSMPTLTIDQYNHIYVLWSGVTNHRDGNNFMVRHLYARASVNYGETWCPVITDLTGGAGADALESVYPSMAPAASDNLCLIYQSDNLAGCYIKGTMGQPGQNVINTSEIRCATVLKSTIVCPAIPQVAFSADNLSPTTEQTVIFIDHTANLPTSWQWSFTPSSVIFLDGTSSTSQNPHVRFTSTGVYTVSLSAANIFGSGSLSKPGYITVTLPPPPTAYFTADDHTIFTGATVLFTDASSGSPTSWDWTFEGGVPPAWSGQTPPPVQYLASGTYDVALVVTNAYGSDTKTRTDYVEVTNPPPPVAGFSGSPDTLKSGNSVQFTDLSSNFPTDWHWIFEGGTPSASTEKSPPPVIYNTAGQFSVSLTVENVSGSDSIIKHAYITVVAPVYPSAGFAANPAVIYAGEQVQFSDASTGNPVAWQWIFDGGSPSASALQHPLPVTYDSAGEYDVTLTVTNEDGTSTLNREKYITVLAPGSPMANFTGTPATANIGSQVVFTDETTGNPASWFWTFEAGEPATFDGQTPPPVTYNEAGSFDVSLKVTNPSGTHTLLIPDYITIINPYLPLAGFTSDKTGIKLGDAVLFTDESTGFPSSYSWTFEGGTPASSGEKSPPPIIYNTPGQYDVTLVVTNPNGSNTKVKAGYISVGGIGLDEAEQMHLLVYPNPAKDKLFFEADLIITEVSIRDVYGNLCRCIPFHSRLGSMDLEGLAPGIYYLSLQQDARLIIRKIVIR